MTLKKISGSVGDAVVASLFVCLMLVPIIGTIVFVCSALDFASNGSHPGYNDLEGNELIPVAIVASAAQILVSFTALHLILKGLS